MAIQVRRGLQKDFKPDKMLPGEMAVTTDTRRIYTAFAPGDCKRMATYEDMQSDIKDATAEIVEELTTEANAATAKANTAAAEANTATTKASTAASAANTATSNANAATSAANTAKANAEKATAAANTAATNANTAKANAEKATTAANTAATSATEAAQEARDAAEQALSKGVTGVKGSAETSYRSGQVELTPANLGIVAATASASGLMSASDKSKLDGIAAGANKTTIDASLSSTSSNPVQNKAVNSALSGKLGTSGDAKDVTVTYTSNDSTTAQDATPPAVMTSGEKLSALLGKISTFGKNVRWLLSKMGSTDISTIGDGTVTGAISTLNSNLSKALFLKQFAVKNGLTLAPGQRVSYLYEKNTFYVQGYVQLSFFTFSSGQNYVSIDVAFVDNNVYFTVINNHQSSSLTFDVFCLIVYGKKGIVNIAN